MAAAGRSDETRNAGLRQSRKSEALDARMASDVLHVRTRHEGLGRRLNQLDQRVGALEAGFVDQRGRK